MNCQLPLPTAHFYLTLSPMKIQLNKSYAFLTILLFLTEVCIALFVKDKFIRPYFGDLLVVILIYCFVKTFFNTPIIKTAIAVLLFAYFVELLQYLQLIEILGLQHSKLAKIIMGSAFNWLDMLMYTVGIGIVLIVEFFFRKRK